MLLACPARWCVRRGVKCTQIAGKALLINDATYPHHGRSLEYFANRCKPAWPRMASMLCLIDRSSLIGALRSDSGALDDEHDLSSCGPVCRAIGFQRSA